MTARPRKMPFFRLLLPLLLLLPLPLLPEEGTRPRVIVLSWDGMRHDYMDFDEFPALARLAKEGVRARMTPVYPSNTFPGHVSMATGVSPARHGILDNRFFDRVKGNYQYSAEAAWIEAEPIWITATRQDKTAAVYFWVGSETDWYGERPAYRVAPFDNSRSESRKVDQILAWLDLHRPGRFERTWVSFGLPRHPLFVRLFNWPERPEAGPPDLIMSYWAGADRVGHRKGPKDPAVIRQIKKQDRQLGRLLAALDEHDLWAEITLLLVSDHGMAEVSEVADLASPLRDAGIRFKYSAGASVAHIFLEDPSETERARAQYAKVQEIKVLSTEEVQEKGFYFESRVGDLVLAVEPPHVFGRRGRRPSPGAHGFDPNRPDMGALFLAMGRGVSRGKKLDDVHQLDLVPTIAKLLSIQPPPAAEGKPMPLE